SGLRKPLGGGFNKRLDPTRTGWPIKTLAQCLVYLACHLVDHLSACTKTTTDDGLYPHMRTVVVFWGGGKIGTLSDQHQLGQYFGNRGLCSRTGNGYLLVPGHRALPLWAARDALLLKEWAHHVPPVPMRIKPALPADKWDHHEKLLSCLLEHYP